ncbi:uracil-DNA glycosylase family protein [Clostridium sardiniense]|uniref:hypothetical protein n=1 Tax=Clostridium sardiniense TaxID=29369 RepID=UPI00278066DD|nr:hypothetical protein [Clostridium sardiniense]MDQ0462102.1 hypoxanthine-DNA glycosylase [Clostridium sardiniense]
MLLNNKIAIWDTIESCDIADSSNSIITNVIPIKLEDILEHSNIKAIYTNGTKAYELYYKYLLKETEIEATKLQSTSIANARYKLEKLIYKTVHLWRCNGEPYHK